MAKAAAAQQARRILVTGSTGYVGGRLVPLLLDRDYRVKVLARDPARLQRKPWLDQVEVAQGDALDLASLQLALDDVDVAYYLIHSMVGSPEFREREARIAQNFATAARRAGLKRIIYLGGLGDPKAELSDHLRSRQLTGEVLRESGVIVTEFRAAVIIGSGSASFEMVRYLVEGLPVVLCPRWVTSRVQPIGIRDVLAYLVEALEQPAHESQIIEIGGGDVLTYREILERYAALRSLRRPILVLPGMPASFCARMVDWLTPIPASLAGPLIEGLHNDALVRDDLARRLFPSIEPMGVDAALLRALTYLQAGRVETTWRDAFDPGLGRGLGLLGSTRQGVIMLRLEKTVPASQQKTYETLLRLGSSQGWGFRHPLWRSYRKLGGLAGAREAARQRRGPTPLRQDDVVDGWRVMSLESPRSMHLQAERHLGGSAWMVFEIQSRGDNSCQLTLMAYYAPHGFRGVLSWYLLAPVRSLALRRVGRRIRQLAIAA